MVCRDGPTDLLPGWVLISVESQEEQEQFWDGINPVLGNKNVSHR